jgi:hypothetical protein
MAAARVEIGSLNVEAHMPASPMVEMPAAFGL